MSSACLAGSPGISPRVGSLRSAHSTRLAVRVWAALIAVNLRYWITVFPAVDAEIAHWQRRAEAIPDPLERRLAVEKLRGERFNVELAATLATLAPRGHRRLVSRAIVALQVAYDFLDVLGEQPRAGRELACDAPLEASGEQSHNAGNALCDALLDAIALDRRASRGDGYLDELVAAAKQALAALPAAQAIQSSARRAAERCTVAQQLGHAAVACGDEHVQRWAETQARATRLGWPEWLAGAQASVLCLHVLIAAAADPRTTPAGAELLDTLYLSIGALTMLDSLIDRAEDSAIGELGYNRFYASSEEMGLALARAAHEATHLAHATPRPSVHLTVLAGVVAYYSSDPSATSVSARPVVERVRAELGPAITPAMAIMHTWRAVKRCAEVLERN